MTSKAATEVKMGFFIAAGFWAFGLVMVVILALALRALAP